ncbi:MAG: helix-turn-helix domain-containing protein [Verrucomicrobia bacterium]|nr:helix-turn-helix domain-containing protein [Verrucomicrobiota bacterium]
MKAMANRITFAKLPKTYEGLVHLHMLRPIHDEVELANATEVIDAMAGHKLNVDQDAYLEALSTLVEAYEAEHHRLGDSKITGRQALEYLLDANGLSAADLARLLGVDRSLGVRIIAGERRLTADHLRILSKRFKVSADLFL